MEEFEETKPDHTQVETLIITEDIRSHIYETAKWAKFLSIMGFIFCVLIILMALSLPSLMAALKVMGQDPTMGVPVGVFSVTYIISALLYFYPSFMLFKYARAAQKGVLFMDQESLSEAFSKMKSFFKFWGVLAIVMLGILSVMVLMSIVTAISAAS